MQMDSYMDKRIEDYHDYAYPTYSESNHRRVFARDSVTVQHIAVDSVTTEEPSAAYRKTDTTPWCDVYVDLDGVICESYWPGPEENIPNLKPIDGVHDALNTIRESGFRVVIWTSRPERLRQVTEEWLRKHNIPYDELRMDKPRYIVAIDDRNMQFFGDWKSIVGKIVTFRPWWYIGQNPETFEEMLELTLQMQWRIMVERQFKYGIKNIQDLGLSGVFSRIRYDKMNRLEKVYRREQARELALQEGVPLEIVDKYLPSLKADYGDETLVDTLIDIANYAGPISIALVKKWWGKPLGVFVNHKTEFVQYPPTTDGQSNK